MTNAWWENEAPVPNRRQGLTHTQPEMPTSGDIWKILKHVVHSFLHASSHKGPPYVCPPSMSAPTVAGTQAS